MVPTLMSYGELRSKKLCTEGRYDEAIAAAQAEALLQPDEPEAHFNRGQALAGLERFAEAAAAYEDAVGMDTSGSSLDPEALDDELFFALRRHAEGLAKSEGPGAGRAAAVATLERYLTLLPAGRHVDDVPKWLAKLNGVEAVWVRDRG